MDEKQIIRYIRTCTQSQLDGEIIEAGPGDDAACVRTEEGSRLVLTTDMLIEGTHFRSGTSPEKVGVKAVRRALSDIAAMAAEPLCIMVAVSFPEDISDSYQRQLCRSMQRESMRLRAPLIGGDTCCGTRELVLTVTAAGVGGPGGLLRRSGAMPGDSVCVTGALGGSHSGRHLTPQPRIEHSLELAREYNVRAMIDISDGLSTDLLHIAEESGVGISLCAGAVPVHQDALEMVRREGGGERDAISHALGDGEDYELLFCLPRREAEELVSAGIQGTKVSIIGTVTKERENTITWPDGTETELKDTGWRHLNNR